MDLPIKYSYEVLEVAVGTPSDSPQALGRLPLLLKPHKNI